MMREEGHSRDGMPKAEELDVGPGLLFMPFIVMEDLLDKLKLLNYDTEFVKTLKMKPLHRHYFAIQTNPGEQFYVFTSLAAWLIRKTGRQFEQPQEYDDPNSTISGILDVLRQMTVPVNFPPSKLKQGFGEHAVFVLDRLADAAISSNNFVFKKPQPPVETDVEEDVVEDESELLLEKVEEEMADTYSDDDEEENLFHLDDLQNLTMNLSESHKPDEVLESNTDVERWKLELEQVLPQLKVTIKTDMRDWRSHLEQMHGHRAGMTEALGNAKLQLDRLHNEVSRTLDKVSSREKYLNNQLETLLGQYRTKQDELSRISAQYREVNGGVSERTKVLARISEELEIIKHEMEERGSSMTDGTLW